MQPASQAQERPGVIGKRCGVEAAVAAERKHLIRGRLPELNIVYVPGMQITKCCGFIGQSKGLYNCCRIDINRMSTVQLLPNRCRNLRIDPLGCDGQIITAQQLFM